MQDFSNLPTIFDEVMVVTDKPENHIGKSVAKDVIRKWTEDIVDENTGEIVQIERSELLYYAGTVITKDNLPSIRFNLDTNEIAKICLSNQERPGYNVRSSYPHHYIFYALQDSKKVAVYLTASNIVMADQIGTDFCESVLHGGFVCEKIAQCNMKFIPPTAPEEEGAEYQYFQVVTEVSPSSDDPYLVRYITYAKNSDQASDIIRNFRTGLISVPEDKDLKERIVKVMPIKLDYIVPDRFFEVYRDKGAKGVHRWGHWVFTDEEGGHEL